MCGAVPGHLPLSPPHLEEDDADKAGYGRPDKLLGKDKADRDELEDKVDKDKEAGQEGAAVPGVLDIDGLVAPLEDHAQAILGKGAQQAQARQRPQKGLCGAQHRIGDLISAVQRLLHRGRGGGAERSGRRGGGKRGRRLF